MRLIFPRDAERAAAYVLAIVLGLTLDITGALHVYGLSMLMGQRLAAGAALLLLIIAGGWLRVASSLPPTPPMNCERYPGRTYRALALLTPPIIRRILTLLMLQAWLATAIDFLVFLAPGSIPPWALVFGVGTLALPLALIWPPAPGWVAVGAALLGVIVRVASYPYIPIEPARGDMLPLVQSALDNLLAGRSPYTIYSMPWDVPLTYLPLTWLAYLPPRLLGLDIRLTNVLAELVVAASLAWLAVMLRPTSESRRSRLITVWRGEPALLLWAWIFLEPTALHWSLTTTAPVQLALLCVALALLVAERRWMSSAALGLCLAATLLAAVVVPFMVLCWIRSSGLRRTIPLVGIAGLIGALLALPFFLWSPHDFIYGVWIWFNTNDQFPRLRWDMDNTWARVVGFSGIFWRHGLVDILKPLQALLIAGLAALYWRWGASAHRLAPFVAAAFLLFTVFNPILWPYLYNPALIGALLAATTLGQYASEAIPASL